MKLPLLLGTCTCMVTCIFSACGPRATSIKNVVEDAAVRVGVELCKEEMVDAGLSAEETSVLCESGGKIVRVVLPRRAWYGMKAAAGDAGPGK